MKTPLSTLYFTVFLPTICLIFLPGQALAHHLGVFAYANGPDIVVTASFGNNRPDVNGRVTVTDSRGRILFRGNTDSKGQLIFPRPQLGPQDTLKIVVSGGPGHQGAWTMTPDDLGTGAGDFPGTGNAAITEKPAKEPQFSTDKIDQQKLARLVSQAVAREIGPLKAMMVRHMDSGPSLKNIVGGVGWLVGIGGLLAAWSSRKKR